MEHRPANEIVQIGEPVLRRKAKHVVKRDISSPQLKALIARMRELLAQEKNGVGLAAPQVGVPLALFIVAGRVFDESESGKSDPGKAERAAAPRPHPRDRVFINPELTRMSRKKKEMQEGCLSVRGTYGAVVRHEKASIRALDESGAPVALNASGLLAHIFQHEVDHLNGILFIDKAANLEAEAKQKSVRT